ncbi:MAG TPA: imidazole glycerol phosphate synthase subunit HisH [Chloroflexota bacterium]|nr:imidazole glycerol phosphate synthase subunit HisH [Chloroflexota bacterium]
MLVIVDYDAGNLRSVTRAVEHAGGAPLISADPEVVRQARAIILPGVGSAAQAMERLRQLGLDQALLTVASQGIPILGVCLGLQVLLKHSEEGGGAGTDCLGLLPGTVRRFAPGPKVPHMGWNTVALRQTSALFEGIPDQSYFYFVHSYYGEPPEDTVIGQTDYPTPFCSVMARDSIVATQFHPEKSGPVGLRIYANFLRMAGLCS